MIATTIQPAAISQSKKNGLMCFYYGMFLLCLRKKLVPFASKYNEIAQIQNIAVLVLLFHVQKCLDLLNS